METDDTYITRFPQYCRTCRGAGNIEQANVPDPSITDCDDCLAQGNCPRCGKTFERWALAIWRPCAFCGWYRDDPLRALPSAQLL
jgi:hypothetical protein